MPTKRKVKIATKALRPMTNLEWRCDEARRGMPLRHNRSGLFLEVGLDEAGMSCLAGPVYTAAVILPPGFTHALIRDSKQLTAEQRNEAREIIIEHAVAYAVAFADVSLIDEINIYHARFKAMHNALAKLSETPEHIPEHIIVDGNRFPSYNDIPHTCIIKGDTKYLSIAAASILAKSSRDAFMLELHEQFTQYRWNSNKGYPTKAHRAAIAEHGPCDYHRKSFTLLKETTDDSAKDDNANHDRRQKISSFATAD